MKDRTYNRLYAYLHGYFWLPCPLCGQYFGGHEWRDYDGKPSSIPTGPFSGRGICPDCTRAGKGRWPDEVLATIEEQNANKGGEKNA